MSRRRPDPPEEPDLAPQPWRGLGDPHPARALQQLALARPGDVLTAADIDLPERQAEELLREAEAWDLVRRNGDDFVVRSFDGEPRPAIPWGEASVPVAQRLERLAAAGPFELGPGELALDRGSEQAARVTLRRAEARGLVRRARARCPDCDFTVFEPDPPPACPRCGRLEPPRHVALTPIELYRCDAPERRPVWWLVVLHGMNTRAPWQERLSWLVATEYGHSVPLAIYKYGKVRVKPFLPWGQDALHGRLRERIPRYRAEVVAGGRPRRPDVIAHSFGTWMLGHALLRDPKLEIGRVILAGSILPPDFPWRQLVDAGRVEAVLNHCGTKDLWARFAHYAIPRSGPSGWRGFDFEPPRRAPAGALRNLPAPGLAHSEFFESDKLPEVLRTTWKPFLERPAATLDASPPAPVRWRPRARAAQLVLWLVLLVLAGMVAAAAAGAVIGAIRLGPVLPLLGAAAAVTFIALAVLVSWSEWRHRAEAGHVP